MDESTSMGDCWKGGFIRTGDGNGDGDGIERGKPEATGGVGNKMGGGGIKEGTGDPHQSLLSLLAPKTGEALVVVIHGLGEG
jgi:hypothetical protein